MLSSAEADRSRLFIPPRLCKHSEQGASVPVWLPRALVSALIFHTVHLFPALTHTPPPTRISPLAGYFSDSPLFGFINITYENLEHTCRFCRFTSQFRQQMKWQYLVPITTIHCKETGGSFSAMHHLTSLVTELWRNFDNLVEFSFQK